MVYISIPRCMPLVTDAAAPSFTLLDLMGFRLGLSPFADLTGRVSEAVLELLRRLVELNPVLAIGKPHAS